MHPLEAQRTIRVEVLNMQNEIIKTFDGEISLNTEGIFEGTIDTDSLPSGTYMLRVGIPQYLWKKIGPITLTVGQENQIAQTALIVGDINGDNVINIADYTILFDCYADDTSAKNCSDVSKKKLADLNNDGNINYFDYNLFIRELSAKSGD
jgi:hypothetical protein